MNTAACKNKGFILDGYPRNANDAKNIFLRKIENYQPPAEGTEVTELFPGFEIIEDIIP
jgi:adenylate kinase family enzyme